MIGAPVRKRMQRLWADPVVNYVANKELASSLELAGSAHDLSLD